MRRAMVRVPVVSLLVVASVGCAGATAVHRVGAGPQASIERVTARRTSTPRPLPACVGELDDDEKVSQLLMVLVGDPSLALDAVAAGQVGGYALTGEQSGDLAAAIATVNAAARFPLLVSGDEEGGTVQRLRSLLGALPSASALASSTDPAGAGTRFGEYGEKMRALGFTMNLGPSLDVGSGSGLGSRSFGESVRTVENFASAVIAGVRRAGLVPVAKHWPGIGGGSVDPHAGPSSLASIETLRARDIVPFRRAIRDGVPAIMVSHAIVPGLDATTPVSLSRAAVTGELRGREHFDGVVITDSLGMGAVSAAGYGDASGAARSIAAGVDIALISDPRHVAEAHRAVLDAVAAGQIAHVQLDRSVARVLELKGITAGCPT